MTKILIANVTWDTDDLGDYWVADLYKRGKKIGKIGTYYSVEVDGKRAPRDIQEATLAEDYTIMHEMVQEDFQDESHEIEHSPETFMKIEENRRKAHAKQMFRQAGFSEEEFENIWDRSKTR